MSEAVEFNVPSQKNGVARVSKTKAAYVDMTQAALVSDILKSPAACIMLVIAPGVSAPWGELF